MSVSSSILDQPQQHELSESLDSRNSLTRQLPLHRAWVVDKIHFAQDHRHDPPPGHRTLQPPCNRLDFWKFRHVVSSTSSGATTATAASPDHPSDGRSRPTSAAPQSNSPSTRN